MFVRPLSGGDWKSLASGRSWPYAGNPDGKWVFYQNTDAAGKHGFFRVAIEGGQPQRLGDFPVQRASQGLWFSPDGRQILAVSLDFNRYDLWLLENFIPTAKQ